MLYGDGAWHRDRLLLLTEAAVAGPGGGLSRWMSIVPAIPESYDDYRADAAHFLAAHRPSWNGSSAPGCACPTWQTTWRSSARYVRALHDAGYVLDRFRTERGDPFEQRILEQELGRAGVPSVLGNPLVAGALKHFGTDEQRATYLPPMARGDHIWTQLFSEPDAGSDLTPSDAWRRDGDDYVVSGRRSGAPGPSGRTSAISSLARSPCKAPAASRPSSSTCAAPASRSVRSAK